MGLLDTILTDLVPQVLGIITNKKAKIRRKTEDYNLTSGVEDRIYQKDHEVTVSPPLEYSLREVDGASIQRGDFKIYVAAKGLKIIPQPNTDTLIRNGLEYRIIWSSPIVSGDDIVIYEMQCRK